jgi:hypothetical protein
MKIKHYFTHFSNRLRTQRAQSLVEFALALPILLMLIFGIIEFGRFMQAWLALENGARFGVRYAVTGNYNPAFCQAAAQALSLEDADIADGAYDCLVPTSYSTDWEELSNRLQDWARLPSIRDTALSGATGIAWDPAAAVSGNYPGYLQNAYQTSEFQQTHRGNPGLPGYFNVTTCSNRLEPTTGGLFARSQFNDVDLHYFTPFDPNNQDDYRFPTYCQRALGTVSGNTWSQTGIERFVDDAGGPGDRVRVVLTYRHTLITPFLNSWWPTVRITAQREGIVEKFRTSRVTGLAGAIGMAPTHTLPPTETATTTVTITPTFTPTPAICDYSGSVLRQWWLNISGTSLNDLTSHVLYPYDPSGNNYPTSFEAPVDWANTYGTRMRAFVCAPWTGDYRFYLASDDNSALFLSNDNQDPGSMVQIANVNGYTGVARVG